MESQTAIATEPTVAPKPKKRSLLRIVGFIVLSVGVILTVYRQLSDSDQRAVGARFKLMPAVSAAQEIPFPTNPVDVKRGVAIIDPPVNPAYNPSVFGNSERGVAQANQPLSQNSDLENRIASMVTHLRAGGKGSEALAFSLKQSLTALFNARHEAQLSRIETLRAELQQAQELLDKRFQLREKIVAKRFNELTGQPDELSWDTVTPPPLPLAPVNAYPMNPRTTYEIMPSYSQPNSPHPNYPVQSYPQPSTLPTGSQGSTTPIASLQEYTQRVKPPKESSPLVDTYVVKPPIDGYVAMPMSSSIAVPSNGDTPPPIPMETQRRFMGIGSALKRMIDELATEKESSNGTATKHAAILQSRIEQIRSVWDFEKEELESEARKSDGERSHVAKQVDILRTHVASLSKGFSSGSVSAAELGNAETAQSEKELQLLNVTSRLETLQRSLEWMRKFEKSLAPPKENEQVPVMEIAPLPSPQSP